MPCGHRERSSPSSPSSSETLILVFAEISSSETCRCSRCWRSFVPKLVSITATSINRSDRSDRSGRSDRSVASVVRSFKIFRNVQGPQNGERPEQLERSGRFERNLTQWGATPRRLRRGSSDAARVKHVTSSESNKMYHRVQDETRPNVVIKGAFARRYAKRVGSGGGPERLRRRLEHHWMDEEFP
jgi:hypothetical protein